QVATTGCLEQRPVEPAFDLYHVRAVDLLGLRQRVFRRGDDHQSAGANCVGQGQNHRSGDRLQANSAEPAEQQFQFDHASSRIRPPGWLHSGNIRAATAAISETAEHSDPAVASTPNDPLKAAGRTIHATADPAIPAAKTKNRRSTEQTSSSAGVKPS